LTKKSLVTMFETINNAEGGKIATNLQSAEGQNER